MNLFFTILLSCLLTPSEVIEVDGLDHPIYVESTLVTYQDFEAFVKATGYKTDAEKLGGSWFDFSNGEWQVDMHATWKQPSPFIDCRSDDPVTQVSLNDAKAYCEWKGGRLLTESEWEHIASNNGTANTKYNWGNEVVVDNKYMCNVWQGNFPVKNDVEDGYPYMSPVKEFPTSKLGFYDLAGNVWEWTSTKEKKGDYNGEYFLKGGSFMCSTNGCHGFKIDASTTLEASSCGFHVGFRVAYDNLPKSEK